jgi:hypothetical protein
MSKIEDGGPAFPHDKYKKDGSEGWGTYAHGGMSLRDHFAGEALPAIVAATSAGYHQPPGVTQGVPIETAIARDSYRLADAMLTVRQESGQPEHPALKWIQRVGIFEPANGHYRVVVSHAALGGSHSYETWAHVTDGKFVGALDEVDDSITAYCGPFDIPERVK